MVAYLLSVLAGAVLPLAFAPAEQFWLAPLSYAVLFYVWRDAAPKRAFGLGFAYGAASFGFGTYWTYIAVREFGEAPIALAAFLTVGLVAVLAAFVAVGGYVAARWCRARGPFAWLVVLPAAFLFTEWLRGWMFTGFGWLAAGYSQTDSWLMGYAPLAGVYGMSAAVLVSAGALLTLVLGTMRARVVAAGVLVAIWGVGFAADRYEFTVPKERELSVALVQGAIQQDLKWRPEQLPGTLALYRELTYANHGADIIVWPEAAIPTVYEYVDGFLDGVRAAASASGSTVLLGILRFGPNGETTGSFQNILLALTDEMQVYVKRHLVPFGEYFPVPSFIRSWMRLMSLPYTDALPGDPDQPLISVAGEQAAITICYEDVFGSEQLRYLPEASLLVNVSNDAWFGDSIAPHQHLQIARVRAAETGRYMLRSTNTGVTAVIDPNGGIVATVPQFEASVLKARVRGYTGTTPYVIVGNRLVVGLAALALAAAIVRQFRMRASGR